MPRNHYEESFGVTRLRWQQGEPDHSEGSLAIVEVWRTTLHAGGYTNERPALSIGAQIELWVHDGSEWKKVDYRGRLLPAYPESRSGFDVRRWAVPASRHWNGRITLDGWDAK